MSAGMPRCAQIELELADTLANGLTSTSAASSIASRTWPCIFSRWRSVFGDGLAWFTFDAEFTGSRPAPTLATCCFEPFWAWSMANIANDASTTSAAIVDTQVRSREITRQVSAFQQQTFAEQPQPPTRERGYRSRAMSFFADPVLLLADGELYARTLPESARGGAAKAVGGATVAAFLSAGVGSYLDAKWARPLWKPFGAKTGTDF